LTAALASGHHAHVAAQADAAEPIAIGENKAGTINDPAAGARFELIVNQPQSALVQVLAMTTGLAPSFTVTAPDGLALLNVENTGHQTVVQGTATLAAPGVYHIDIRSSGNIAGQFLISVQPGEPLEGPQSLSIGSNVEAVVSAATPQQSFHVSGSPTDALLVTVRSSRQESGPAVALRDVASNETLAMVSPRLSGLQIRIPAGIAEYVVDVSHSGSGDAESFIICVESERELPTCPLRQQTAFTPDLIPTLTPIPATVFDTPVALPGLDPAQPPVFGNTGISSGFIPDPFTTDISAGGPVDVSSAGPDCSGFATTAPSFALDYTSGPFPTLRFYFTGAGDTSLVVSAPDGSFRCSDDSFDAFNPSIDFNTPVTGRYHIWVASKQPDTVVAGTLYITENLNNRP